MYGAVSVVAPTHVVTKLAVVHAGVACAAVGIDTTVSESSDETAAKAIERFNLKFLMSCLAILSLALLVA
jgi:hypothetical protein